MIRNLNQINFHDFGTVLSERPRGEKDLVSVDNSTVLDIELDASPVYHLKEEAWVTPSKGKIVLSVSHDGNRFLHFGLDRPVCVNAGVFVCLSAVFGDGAVNYTTKKVAEPIGVKTMQQLAVPSQLQITAMYTFYYEERERGFAFAGESHPCEQLLYVDQGSLHVSVDGKEYHLQQGEMILIGADQWHSFYADMDTAPRYISSMFSLDMGDLSSLYNCKHTATQKMLSLLQQMSREQEAMDTFSNDIVMAHLHYLLLLLLREKHNPVGGKIQSSNAVHSENDIIRRAQRYIASHIREKLSVPIVAKHVDVSPSYLTALFHKNLQISPGEYIRRIKLQESKQMIRENNLNFTEIAAELRYSTVHHFSRQFKEKFGITPTEYAKSVR